MSKPPVCKLSQNAHNNRVSRRTSSTQTSEASDHKATHNAERFNQVDDPLTLSSSKTHPPTWASTNPPNSLTRRRPAVGAENESSATELQLDKVQINKTCRKNTNTPHHKNPQDNNRPSRPPVRIAMEQSRSASWTPPNRDGGGPSHK